MSFQYRIGASKGAALLRERAQVEARRGSQSEFIAQRLNPVYTELAARGRMFVYSTAAAGVALAAVTTTNQFGIWNTSTNLAFVPAKITIGVVSGAAAIAGTVGIYTANLGFAKGTGCPCSVWTDITTQQATMLGAGQKYAPQMRVASTNTLAAAPTLFRTMVFSQLQGQTANAVAPWTMQAAGYPTAYVDMVSTPILLPGYAMFFAANTALALTVVISVLGAEIPIALQS